MRWYFSRNGETAGPVEEAQVIEWVKAGGRDGMVQAETGGQWMPIHQSPFAQWVRLAVRDHPSYNAYTALAFFLPGIGFIAGIARMVSSDPLDRKLGVHTLIASLFFGFFWYIALSAYGVM